MESSHRTHTFFKPETLSLISSLTKLFAWISLAIAILYPAIDLALLDRYLHQYQIISGHWWEWQNLTSSNVLVNHIFPSLVIAIPLLGTFLLLLCCYIGVNVLLEIDFNIKAQIEIPSSELSNQPMITKDNDSDEKEELQPTFYEPEQLLNFSDITSKAAWILAFLYAGIALWQFTASLINYNFMSYPVSYLIVILLMKITSAVVNFFLLKGISNGLKVLMEFEFNSRGVQ